MMNSWQVISLFSLLLYFCVLSIGGTAKGNQTARPIIGVLPCPLSESSTLRKYGKSAFAASYVKWLEQGGARVAVIPYEASYQDLDTLFDSLNGILFTGGGLSLLPNTTYFETALYLFNKATKANEQGDHFPLWGTCQGFELFCILGDWKDEKESFKLSSSGKHDILSEFDSENLPLPLDFSQDQPHSRMLGDDVAPHDVLHTFETQPVTMNLHHMGAKPELFETNKGLKSTFNVLSTNKDRKGLEFTSTIEGKVQPFYATQWHPERDQFEWCSTENLDHSRDAVNAVQYLSRFFVEECRKNDHKFASEVSEHASLIYNYAPIYTGNDTGQSHPDRQTYVFKDF